MPKFGFNWQTMYYLKKPVALPKGTKMIVHGALRQLGEKQVQPRCDEDDSLGRSDLGRDDDRLDGVLR